jgi:hypothetical protein
MAILFGDTPGTLSDHRKGKHQDLVGTANEKNEKGQIIGSSRGR